MWIQEWTNLDPDERKEVAEMDSQLIEKHDWIRREEKCQQDSKEKETLQHLISTVKPGTITVLPSFVLYADDEKRSYETMIKEVASESPTSLFSRLSAWMFPVTRMNMSQPSKPTQVDMLELMTISSLTQKLKMRVGEFVSPFEGQIQEDRASTWLFLSAFSHAAHLIAFERNKKLRTYLPVRFNHHIIHLPFIPDPLLRLRDMMGRVGNRGLDQSFDILASDTTTEPEFSYNEFVMSDVCNPPFYLSRGGMALEVVLCPKRDLLSACFCFSEETSMKSLFIRALNFYLSEVDTIDAVDEVDEFDEGDVVDPKNSDSGPPGNASGQGHSGERTGSTVGTIDGSSSTLITSSGLGLDWDVT
jgi:hypothetical protein